MRLTRGDAIKAAAALLENVETMLTTGRIRPAEAIEVLDALQDVDSAVFSLREVTLHDRSAGSVKQPDGPTE